MGTVTIANYWHISPSPLSGALEFDLISVSLQHIHQYTIFDQE